tara:strand:+ start:203 stop:346 length:144 start_codon:yes stop_codon:yes gene_type:complete
MNGEFALMFPSVFKGCGRNMSAFLDEIEKADLEQMLARFLTILVFSS